MKVTVVVPAYNVSQEFAERLLDSLVAQSLPNDDYEVIVVDDGSGPAAADLLDDLAAQRAVVRVIHNNPNSGWPGKPRNTGIDAAQGEFLYFVDADDWLEPEALERMYEYGTANHSDIVWGKIVGDGRAVPHAIFMRNIPDAKLGRDPLLSLLTVHKMFRTSFIRDNKIRFVEGRVRLEDHLFVMAAYFAAGKISVLGDYSCYHWTRREGSGHISHQQEEPHVYFAHVRKVLDLVEANVPPGPPRDRLLAHWLGAKALVWFQGGGLERRSESEGRVVFGVLRDLVSDRFPPEVDQYLPPTRRVLAGLVRRDDLTGLQAFVSWADGIQASAQIATITWEGDRLRLSIDCALIDAAGETLCGERVGNSMRWALPEPVLAQSPDLEGPTVGDVKPSSLVYLRSRTRKITEVVPSSVSEPAPPGQDGVVDFRAVLEVVVDCAGVAGRRTIDPIGDLVVRFSCAGLSGETRPAAPAPDVLEPLARTIGGQTFRPYGTAGFGNLSLERRDPIRTTVEQSDTIAAVKPHKSGSARTGSPRNGPTLARRAIGLANRFGVGVSDLFPGVSLISRDRKRVRVTPLDETSAVVGLGKRGRRLTSRRLDDDNWLVSIDNKDEPVTAAHFGKRGWLVTSHDAGPRAELDLEMQLLKHFVDRHVAWVVKAYDVDLVIDVGANTGQYATSLRRRGYRGHIASFEPVPRFAADAEKKAGRDERWTVRQMALGSTEGTVSINVQRTFSSLLPSSDYGKQRFTTLRELSDTEQVDVPLRRLDSIFDELLAPVRAATGKAHPRVYLKMDTQGFDLEVFGGLGARADDIVALQSEVALLLIYNQMPRMPEAVATYESAGFEISGLYPVTREKDGRVIEYDCVMVRPKAHQA